MTAGRKGPVWDGGGIQMKAEDEEWAGRNASCLWTLGTLTALAIT